MATIVIPNFNSEKVVNGLNSYTYTIQSAAMHNCKIAVDHPQGSAITVTISQSGSVSATLATITLPGAISAAPNLMTGLNLNACANCSIGDVITFAISSSNSDDQQLQAIKSRINVHVGSIN